LERGWLDSQGYSLQQTDSCPIQSSQSNNFYSPIQGSSIATDDNFLPFKRQRTSKLLKNQVPGNPTRNILMCDKTAEIYRLFSAFRVTGGQPNS
jgi:hypothetical protein